MNSNREDLSSNAQIQSEIEALTSRLERLRVRYEQYFRGAERRAPDDLRKAVVRTIHNLEHTNITNTATRFRFQSLVQKFRTHSIYWNRVMREIENGTYHRHVARAKRRNARYEEQEAASAPTTTRDAQADDAQATPQASNPDRLNEIRSVADDFLASLDGALSGLGDDTLQVVSSPTREPEDEQGLADAVGGFLRAGSGLWGKVLSSTTTEAPRPPAPRPPPTPRPPPAQPPRRGAPQPPPDGQRHLYNQFVEARQRCGDRGSSLDFDAFQRSLERRAQQIKRSHRCDDVDFKVVVRDGKPFLQPIPK